MSDKYGKSLDTSNIAGQIFAQQPSGIGSAGTPLDLNTIQQSYASTFPMDLDYMDMLEKAADEEEFRMLGVTDGPTLEQRQIEAAQTYANLVKSFPTTAQEIADVQAAKAKLVELNVSREQIEAQGIDTSQGISGVMGPSIGGVASQIGQEALDLIGGAGQGFSDLITLGTGPEVAQTLLDPVSILLGGLGGTINYAESGKTTPLIFGQTSSGMPVGLNIPDPRSVLEGGLTTLIPGATAAASAVGALSLGDEKDKDPTSGVAPTAAGVLTAAAADDDDTVKVQEVIVDDAGAGADADDAEIQVAGLESKDKADADIQVDALGALDLGGEFVLSDLPGGGSIRTNEINPYEYETSTPTIKTGETPVIRTGDVGGSGGFGVPTETPSATGQGLTGVSTEKAGVADIGDPYQLSASLYENIMRILQQDRENRRDDRNRTRTYYGGGSVRASDRIDEIARIIRG